jgi:hypothetical protein
MDALYISDTLEPMIDKLKQYGQKCFYLVEYLEKEHMKERRRKREKIGEDVSYNDLRVISI